MHGYLLQRMPDGSARILILRNCETEVLPEDADYRYDCGLSRRDFGPRAHSDDLRLAAHEIFATLKERCDRVPFLTSDFALNVIRSLNHEGDFLPLSQVVAFATGYAIAAIRLCRTRKPPDPGANLN